MEPLCNTLELTVLWVNYSLIWEGGEAVRVLRDSECL